MKLTIRQLADIVQGEVAGDGDFAVGNARTLADAQPGDITFVEQEKNLAAWHNSPASAAVVPAGTPVNGRPLIRVADPLSAFAAIVMEFRLAHPPAALGRIDPRASIHPTATIGAGVTIGPFTSVGEGAVIGDRAHLHSGVSVGRYCTVGADVVLHPHVVLYDETTLGDRVVIHANAVIGADGFGYRTQGGKHLKVPQLGSVEIGSDVEIGANTTIDRGTFGPTRVGEGSKIDNLVMIGHNCRIGRHNLLVSQVGIAGSSETGDYVVMAGQVGVADHIHIGDRVQIGAQSGVVKDVPSDARILGHPARPDKTTMRIFYAIEKLPEMIADLRHIKHKLGLKGNE